MNLLEDQDYNIDLNIDIFIYKDILIVNMLHFIKSCKRENNINYYLCGLPKIIKKKFYIELINIFNF